MRVDGSFEADSIIERTITINHTPAISKQTKARCMGGVVHFFVIATLWCAIILFACLVLRKNPSTKQSERSLLLGIKYKDTVGSKARWRCGNDWIGQSGDEVRIHSYLHGGIFVPETQTRLWIHDVPLRGRGNFGSEVSANNNQPKGATISSSPPPRIEPSASVFF